MSFLNQVPGAKKVVDCCPKGVLDSGKTASVGSVGEGLSTGTFEIVLTAFSLKPYSSVSPDMTPVTLIFSPSTRAQGEWLQKGLCALALYNGA